MGSSLCRFVPAIIWTYIVGSRLLYCRTMRVVGLLSVLARWLLPTVEILLLQTCGQVCPFIYIFAHNTCTLYINVYTHLYVLLKFNYLWPLYYSSNSRGAKREKVQFKYILAYQGDFWSELAGMRIQNLIKKSSWSPKTIFEPDLLSFTVAKKV